MNRCVLCLFLFYWLLSYFIFNAELAWGAELPQKTRTILLGNLCLDRIPSDAFVESTYDEYMPGSPVSYRGFSVNIAETKNFSVKPRVFIFRNPKINEVAPNLMGGLGQATSPPQGDPAPPFNLLIKNSPHIQSAKMEPIANQSLINTNMVYFESINKPTIWPHPFPLNDSPDFKRKIEQIHTLPKADSDTDYSSCDLLAHERNSTALVVAAELSSLSIRGQYGFLPSREARPPATWHFTDSNGKAIGAPKWMWTKAQPNNTAYLVAPGNLNLKIASFLKVGEDGRIEVNDTEFFKYPSDLSTVSEKLLYESLKIFARQNLKLHEPPKVWGGTLNLLNSTNFSISNDNYLVAATGELRQYFTSYATKIIGYAPGHQSVLITASSVEVRGLRMGATEKSEFFIDLVSEKGRDTVLRWDLDREIPTVTQAKWILPTGVPPSMKNIEWKLGQVQISGATVSTNLVLEVGTIDKPKLILNDLELAADALGWEALNISSIGVNLKADLAEFDLLSDSTAPYLSVLPGNWKNVHTEAQYLALGSDVSNSIIGKGMFKAKELSINSVDTAELHLEVNRNGWGALSYIISDEQNESSNVIMNIDGPTDDLTASLRVTGLALGFGQIINSGANEFKSSKFKIRPFSSSISIPIDIDLHGEKGRLKLGAGGRVVLYGGISRFKVKGMLELAGNKTALKIEPDGLNFDIAGAISDQPWLAGGKPEFASARLTLTAPSGLEVNSDGTVGVLNAFVSSMTLVDPKIQLATNTPDVVISLPWRTEGNTLWAISMPAGTIAPLSGKYVIDGPIKVSSSSAGRFKLGDAYVYSPKLNIGRFELAYSNGQSTVALKDVSIETKSLEFGGMNGVLDQNSTLYWKFSPNELLKLDQMYASTDSNNNEIVLHSHIIKGLLISTGSFSFLTRDGFKYDGSSVSININELSSIVYADFFVGPGKLSSKSDSLSGKLKVDGIGISLRGEASQPHGNISISLSRLDVTASNSTKLLDSCDSGNPNLDFESTVNIPSFEIRAELNQRGEVTGIAKISRIVTKFVLSEPFRCRFKDYVKIDVPGRTPLCWYCPPFSVGTDMIFMATMDHFRIGIQSTDTEFRLANGLISTCVRNVSLEEPAVGVLAVAITPSTGIQFADHFIAEAKSTIWKPIDSLFTSGFINNVAILGSFMAKTLESEC